MNIIKKLLEESKNYWHTNLEHALWADRLTLKKHIGMSPYHLVYGTDAIFPTSLGVPVMRLIQEVQSDDNDMIRRINQTIHLQQTREEFYNKALQKQDNIKKLFDRRKKDNNFNVGDKVLKWDSRREDKGKHGKFDNLWLCPYLIHSTAGNNAYFLQELNGAELFGGSVNGRMLKHYFS